MASQPEKPWNSADYRPFWADPMGRLLSTDECGCRHYELGNGLCEVHWVGLFKGFEELLDREDDNATGQSE